MPLSCHGQLPLEIYQKAGAIEMRSQINSRLTVNRTAKDQLRNLNFMPNDRYDATSQAVVTSLKPLSVQNKHGARRSRLSATSIPQDHHQPLPFYIVPTFNNP